MDRTERIKNEISGVLSILLGIVIIISLLSHSEWDPSPFTYPAHGDETKNLLGPVGSYLSDIMLKTLGLTSYIIPLILFIYGLRRLFSKEKKPRHIVSIGVITLIISSSSLLSLVFEDHIGGIVGFLSTRLSVKLLSPTGSYLLFIPMILVTLMFLLPFSISDLIVKIRLPSILGGRKKRKESLHLFTGEQLPATGYTQEPFSLVSSEPGPAPLQPQGGRFQKVTADYELPHIELLRDPPAFRLRPAKEELLQSSSILEKKLQDFGVEGRITHVSPGPIVTMFEFEPAPGVKIHKVMSLADDLALSLKAVSMRVSTIPGRATLGIEVPNKEREDVFLKEILSSEAFRRSQSKLTLALGKDIFGNPVVADLWRMPHLLVAGTTGSGKSVAMNSMVLSLLYRAKPEELKMLMIDPKMLELSHYEAIPHLILPVITSPKEAADALKKIVLEMERRYKVLAERGVRNIESFNRIIKSISGGMKKPLPYIVIFIDELADLMLVSAYEVEESIARLAQMARAVGIHLILATQRPSVDVITGVIKANFPSRIAFQVSSKIDSRVILDTYGAERLLGKGDMLFMSPGSRTIRVHGAYVSEEEIKAVTEFIKTQGSPEYSLFDSQKDKEPEGLSPEDADELYQQAKDLVLSTGQASISYIQRRLKIGYNRAARIMEMMEEEGIVAPPGEAGKPREILRKKK